MLITTSIHEANTFFIFKKNGTETKVLFKDDTLTVLSGYLYSKTKEIAIKKIKEIN